MQWGELRAVVLTGRAGILPAGEERDGVIGLVSEKYKGFGMAVDEVPSATIRHYDTEAAVIRIDPEPRRVTWDNRKLRRRSAGA